MAGRIKKKKEEKVVDPEVQAAIKNLGGLPVPSAPPVAAAPGEDQRESLETLNGIPPAPAAPHRERKEYHKTVRTTLGEEELLDQQRQLLAALDQVDKLDADRKAVMAEWKGYIDRANEDVHAIRRALREGREETVLVEETKDFDAGTVTIIRLDTKEVVEGPRPFLESEKQTSLLAAAEETETFSLEEVADPAASTDEAKPGGEAEAAAEAEQGDGSYHGNTLELPGKPRLSED